jgi:hypothetical protein
VAVSQPVDTAGPVSGDASDMVVAVTGWTSLCDRR